MYLDPGLGGMLLQIVVALVAAGGATLFVMRKKIRNFFSKGSKDAETPNRPESGAIGESDDVIDTLDDDE